MTVIGEISGANDLANLLRALPGKVQQDKLLAKALRKGAAVIRDAAHDNLVANGSVDSGLLANTMIIARKGEDIAGLVEISLRPSSKLSMVIRKGKHTATPARPSKYAHFVEFGTEHMAARPFMRPALDSKGTQAVDTIRSEVLTGVANEARQLGLTVG